eukprot:TCALIF_05133-PA protein Name:"Protein of unknown function" AED:0.28 eAED:0.28 QI:85/0.66/0.5/1/0.33/0.5/4/0/176
MNPTSVLFLAGVLILGSLDLSHGNLSCYTGISKARVENKCDDPQIVNCITRTTKVGGITQHECGSRQLREPGCVEDTTHTTCYCDTDLCNGVVGLASNEVNNEVDDSPSVNETLVESPGISCYNGVGLFKFKTECSPGTTACAYVKTREFTRKESFHEHTIALFQFAYFCFFLTLR